MYRSIRDAMVFGGEFETPVAGLRRLEIDAIEIHLDGDFRMMALDSDDSYVIHDSAEAQAYRSHLDGLGVRCCCPLTARDLSHGNSLGFLLNVLEEVGSERAGLTLDTANFYWRGYPLSEVYGILKLLVPYARHTHPKNIAYPEDKREIPRDAGWEYEKYMCPLDEGDIDHGRVLQMLAGAGYCGDVCIENESLERFAPGADRVRVLERDAAFARELIASIEQRGPGTQLSR